MYEDRRVKGQGIGGWARPGVEKHGQWWDLVGGEVGSVNKGRVGKGSGSAAQGVWIVVGEPGEAIRAGRMRVPSGLWDDDPRPPWRTPHAPWQGEAAVREIL